MSYILDALNKSEAEKQRKRAAPGLDALHRRTPTHRRSLWPLATLMALLLILANGALFYWWTTTQQPAPAATSQPQSQSQSVPTPMTPPTAKANDDTSSAAPATEPQASGELITPQSARRVNSSPTATNNAEAQARPVVAIAELPSAVKTQLPDLRFSSHIYASDPDLRMVNINGSSLREGEAVGQGVRLIEITEDGVILGFEDYRFEVSVLRDWSAG